MKKRNIIKRGFGFCLGILLLLNLMPLVARGIQPTYTFSSLYKQSEYHSNFTSLVLTGDQATDVISIASTQLGFHEGNSNSDFAGGNLSGTKNFVEYNRLYGLIDNNEGNGLSYGYEWCASFVNWVLRQSRVPVSASGSFVSCTGWVSYLIDKSMYRTRSTYTPKTGDIIFFKDSGSTRLSTHVGLVRYVEGNTVYTIEGNSGGGVNIRSYLLSDTYIVGYGTPSYSSDKQLALDFSGKTNINGIYIASVNGANVRLKPQTGASIITYLTRGQTVNIDRIENGWGHTIYNGADAWVSMSVIYLVSGNISTVKYNMNGGIGEIQSQTLMYNELYYISDVAPTRDGYNFIGWSDRADSKSALYIENNLYNSNRNVTLYAVWEEIVVDVDEKPTDETSHGDTQESDQTDTGENIEQVGNPVNMPIDGNAEITDTLNNTNIGADIVMSFMLLAMPLLSFSLPLLRHRK